MSYYFEIWLRGYAKDQIREQSTYEKSQLKPHCTLVRPFHIISSEEKVKEKVEPLFKTTNPIFYSLKGEATFDNEKLINYIPIINGKELLEFDSKLEQTLESEVQFYEKLNEEKILHIHIDHDKQLNPMQQIDQYALRITAMKKNKIWFSYDLVNKEFLNREESLDQEKWYQTIHEFSKKFKYLPTRNGYKKIK